MEAKELYEIRKKQGICVYCGKEKAIENRIWCGKCREKMLGITKETYKWCKEKGICVRCHKEKAVKGQVLCTDCANKMRRRK